jgi:hippurate hydrolase
MQLIESILADAAVATTIRRDIHAHPELCFQEQRTADVIAAALTEWGIPVHRGLGKTGVVGIVKAGTSNRALGLRADIDALPMTEHNTFAHASQHPERCTPAATMATPRCCWPPRATSASTATSTAPST